MKKHINLIIAVIIIFGNYPLISNAGNTPDLKGKKYIGKPTKQKSYSGCEGCGERGYFTFSKKNNTVEFVWPGSDEIEIGTYKLTGLKLTITANGEIFIFSVSKNGREIVYLKNKIVFKDQKYPWK